MPTRFQDILLNAVSATGAGAVLNGDDRQASIATFTVTITGTATITFQGIGDGSTNYESIPVTSVADTPVTSPTVTASGVYRCDATGLTILPNVTSYGSGTVTVVGSLSTGTLSGGASTGTVSGTVSVSNFPATQPVSAISGAVADLTTVITDLNTINTSINANPSSPLPTNLVDSTGAYITSVLPASTPALVTHLPIVTALHPSSPVPSGENHVGELGGNSQVNQPSLAVTIGTYTTGNCVGGKLTLTNAMRKNNGTGVLQNLVVVDHSNSKPNLDIIFFSASPAATLTDKNAFPTLSAADCLLVVARISVASTDWVSVGSVGFVAGTFQPKVVAATGTQQNLYAAINTTSAPVFAATTDLTLTVGFLRD